MLKKVVIGCVALVMLAGVDVFSAEQEQHRQRRMDRQAMQEGPGPRAERQMQRGDRAAGRTEAEKPARPRLGLIKQRFNGLVANLNQAYKSDDKEAVGKAVQGLNQLKRRINQAEAGAAAGPALRARQGRGPAAAQRPGRVTGRPERPRGDRQGARERGPRAEPQPRRMQRGAGPGRQAGVGRLGGAAGPMARMRAGDGRGVGPGGPMARMRAGERRGMAGACMRYCPHCGRALQHRPRAGLRQGRRGEGFGGRGPAMTPQRRGPGAWRDEQPREPFGQRRMEGPRHGWCHGEGAGPQRGPMMGPGGARGGYGGGMGRCGGGMMGPRRDRDRDLPPRRRAEQDERPGEQLWD